RMELQDKPGALAKVASVLGDAGISIDRMRQYGHGDDDRVPVLIVTHKTTPDAIDHAIEALPQTGVLSGEPVELRIEEV
ncbi:MAG: ACT domain-containing protein, partial [Paracoccus sp. (in: a-proteobacteria)]